MSTDVVSAVLAGQVAAGARLIRWLEDADPRGRAALAGIYPHTGRAHLVGITGPGGVGKSTLVDMLITEQRQRGRRVGVVAVDPSSPFTGGAILGDRVRMQRHAADEGVFIRSMGTRGQLGGLARASYDAMLVLDAMGYEVIFVETVGVGQDEIEIVALAHSTIIVAAPGLGDEIQAIKAGLMEAGDLFVLNKADREGALQTLRQLEMALHLREHAAPVDAWKPPVLQAVAARGEGGAGIVDVLDRHAEFLRASGAFETRRAHRAHEVFVKLLRDAATRKILETALARPDAAAVLADVAACRLDPHAAADLLCARLSLEPAH